MMSKNSLLQYDIDYSLLDTIDNDILYKYNIMPIYNNTLYLEIATSKPSQDIREIMEIFKKPIKFITVEHNFLEFEWRYLELKIKLYRLSFNALNNISLKSENGYILEFIDEILKFSIQNDVSDIHCESLEKSIILRFRIDGVLNQFFRFDISLYAVISSIVKFLANLDISQKRKPLNGRFSRIVFNKNYDFRVSTLPTIYGESIVLRILDNKNIQKDLKDIGFEDITLQTIKKTLQLTQGLILVTGPTGSGKTTSLYSMLNFLNTKNIKIVTIEDPVEYKLDGIIQVNINNDIDLDYHTVLKNILRQDPDILMIGEIRDTQSLQIAMQAALTGHLVIATLHTNNSIETITRLLDLEAQPYLIAATLKMVISQRLLRVLCPACKEEDIHNSCYKDTGCKECNLTGYSGRKIVCEILQINDELSKMISNNENLSQITKKAKKYNFKSLQENGKILIQEGITSLSEYYNKI